MSQTPFRTYIRRSLADSNLQAALDANAERRQSARLKAYASLPGPLEELRRRAHAIRLHTIDHLDELLAEFTRNAAANGWVIHPAADARQAVDTVLEIARRSAPPGRPPLVAKAKTMLGEEIGLNPALETAGLRVVETDLGEFIVQLRGEHPAHMTSPAVHLRRSDVGQTFHEKLGIPYSDDVLTLTAAARRALRQVFLDATLGVSGVNFGVAQTGGVCLITNEGNGRMVTSLPPVYVALMGIERLVPSLDDLAVMLYLLPRSSSGQKLTVYTSLIHGPRQPGEADGPIERHLVLVDNGRRALRASRLREALNCIRCGACLNVCPVFRELGGHAYVGASGEIAPYSGPIGSVLSPALFGAAEFAPLARASSLCGACKEVCPVDIDLPKLLLRVRAGEVAAPMFAPAPPLAAAPQTPKAPPVSPPSAPNPPAALAFGVRVFAWLAASPARFAQAQRVAALLARLARPFLSGKPHPGGAWLNLSAWSGWGASREFPLPALRPFRARIENLTRRTTTGEQIVSPTLPLGSGWTAAQPHGPTPGEQKSTPADLLARFQAELEAVGGHFTACRPGELSSTLSAWLKAGDIHAIAAWEAHHLPLGLLDELAAAGVAVSHAPDPTLRLGLTGCAAAIAESGTLVIASGPGRPLSASLLPEIHVAILRSEHICTNLPQALGLRQIREASNTVLITGPSRSADIEMSLTIGVHGPGEVWVFCSHE